MFSVPLCGRRSRCPFRSFQCAFKIKKKKPTVLKVEVADVFAGQDYVERGALTGISPIPWQTDTAIGKCSWGYRKDNEYKSARQVICDLVDIVSKNGLYSGVMTTMEEM